MPERKTAPSERKHFFGGKLWRLNPPLAQGDPHEAVRRGKTALIASFILLLGCSAWKEPWTLSQKKLGELCRPFQAQKEAETFKAKVQKDPFPEASVLNKISAHPPGSP